jgi:hypothetical protein
VRDLGGVVLSLVAGPMVKVFGRRGEDPDNLREYVGTDLDHPYATVLRHAYRAYAWAFVVGGWGVAGILAVTAIRPLLGDAAADRAFAVVLGGTAAIIAMSLLSGARAAVVDRLNRRGANRSRLARTVSTPSNVDVVVAAVVGLVLAAAT